MNPLPTEYPWGTAVNQFHPLVYTAGDIRVGEGTYVGLFSELNAQGSKIVLGRYCDIASFVSLNVADSHRATLAGIPSGTDEYRACIERRPIALGDHVFVGSHSFIGGGWVIGEHTVIGAGTILVNREAGILVIPPRSLVVGNPATIKAGYYEEAA